MALTDEQRANLLRLANYLETLPRDYQHFDMSSFLNDHGDQEAITQYAKENGGVTNCGTSACAVGHGPAAGILFQPHEFLPFTGSPDWSTYAERFISDHKDFGWAFDGMWDRVDNHHWGAAARIRYLLKHGQPPPGFSSPHPTWHGVYRPFDKRFVAPELLEALEPFAIAETEFSDLPDDHPIAVHITAYPVREIQLTLADFRRARAAIAKATGA